MSTSPSVEATLLQKLQLRPVISARRSMCRMLGRMGVRVDSKASLLRRPPHQFKRLQSYKMSNSNSRLRQPQLHRQRQSPPNNLNLNKANNSSNLHKLLPHNHNNTSHSNNQLIQQRPHHQPPPPTPKQATLPGRPLPRQLLAHKMELPTRPLHLVLQPRQELLHHHSNTHNLHHRPLNRQTGPPRRRRRHCHGPHAWPRLLRPMHCWWW